MAELADRALPNILITGTPGTGKSTMAQQLQALAPVMRHIEVGALVKDKQMHNGWDNELETYEMDEERVRPRQPVRCTIAAAAHAACFRQVLDELEEMLEPGGGIVDFHGAELFPERWFDLVLVLRTDNTVLYPRLQGRRARSTAAARALRVLAGPPGVRSLALQACPRPVRRAGATRRRS